MTYEVTQLSLRKHCERSFHRKQLNGSLKMTRYNVLTGQDALISVPNIPGGFRTGNFGGIQNPDTLINLMNVTLMPTLLSMLISQKYAPRTKKSFDDEYDYVIVGGGVAGSVLANRLSEKKCVRVLLLEAGKPPPVMSEIPGIARALVISDINWNFLTEPQKYTGRQLFQRRLPYPAGKGLGGSSIINAMLYIRGNHRDYDDWERMGAKGWSWKKLKPYFLKLENNTDEYFLSNGWHHVGGPMTASRVRYHPTLKTAVLKAEKYLGYKIVDPNARSQLGFSDYQTFMRNGRRCSTAKAYLVPVDHRPNLDIVTEAYVTKVRISRKKARGVYVKYKGKSHYVKARREVIISAGAVNSPQILMLSGIGEKETLDKFNIPVKADLPVGKNLQDHPTAIAFFSLDHRKHRPYLQKLLDPRSIVEYHTNGSGPLASPTGVFQIGFLRSNESVTHRCVPDYEPYFIEGENTIARLTFGLKPSVYEKMFLPYEFSPVMWCFSSILNPKSRGYVSIRSSNPYDPPIIDPNFLHDPEDVKSMVAGLITCMKIARTPAMKKAGVKPFKTLMPGCKKFAHNEYKYWECYIKAFIFTISHQSCTVKMGDPSDPTTVVDPKLRVKGIGSLRVVDASVMPKVISGNTNIPTVMIAEKASDMIKKNIKC